MGLNPDTRSSHLFVITCTMCLINNTVFPSPQGRAWNVVSAQLIFIKWMNIFTCHPLTKSERELPYFLETLRPLVWRKRLGKRQRWYQNAPLRLREETLRLAVLLCKAEEGNCGGEGEAAAARGLEFVSPWDLLVGISVTDGVPGHIHLFCFYIHSLGDLIQPHGFT